MTIKSKSDRDDSAAKNTSRFLEQRRKVQTVLNIINTYKLTTRCVEGIYFSTYDPSVITGVSYLIYPKLLFVARKTQDKQTLLYASNVVFFRYQSSLNNTIAALLKSTFQNVCLFYVNTTGINDSMWYNVYMRTQGVVIVEEPAFSTFLVSLNWNVHQEDNLYIFTRR